MWDTVLGAGHICHNPSWVLTSAWSSYCLNIMSHRENTARHVLMDNPLEKVWPSLKFWHCLQCHFCVNFYFQGKILEYKKKYVKEVELLIKFRWPCYTGTWCQEEFSYSVTEPLGKWFCLMLASVNFCLPSLFLSIHWRFQSHWGWVLRRQEMSQIAP